MAQCMVLTCRKPALTEPGQTKGKGLLIYSPLPQTVLAFGKYDLQHTESMLVPLSRKQICAYSKCFASCSGFHQSVQD